MATKVTSQMIEQSKAILRAAGIQIADEGMAEDFYEYTVPQLAVPAAVGGVNGSASASIVFQADSAFDVIKALYFANIANAAQTNNTRVIPNITVLIVDSGAGRQLMNSAVPLYNLFGTAENPFIWPIPKRIAPNSTWTFTFSNFEATAYNLAITFAGKKIFYAA